MQVSHDLTARKSTLSTVGARLHRGRGELFVGTFFKESAIYQLAAGETVWVVGKPKGKRETARIFSFSVTVADYDAPTSTYRKTFSTDTQACRVLLGILGDDTASDKTTAALDVSLVFIPSFGADPQRGDMVDVTLEDTPYNEDDAAPTVLDTPLDWLLANGLVNPGYWTAYQGSTATCLDNVSIYAYPLNHCFDTAISGVPRRWQIQVGTNATNISGGYLRTLDYNALDPRILVEI